LQVGNALTDGYSDNLGAIKFYYYHSIISDQTYTTLIQNCNFSVDGPVVESIPNATCDNAVNYAYNVEVAEINPYNIYGLNCNPPATTNRPAFIKVPKTYLDGLFIILLDMKRP
jgi:serine carboxypeptidase-like clade 2